MKCKHLNRVQLVEYGGPSCTSHDYDKGKVWNDHDYGDYNGIVKFLCFDCGFEKEYNIFKNCPKYIMRWCKYFRSLGGLSSEEMFSGKFPFPGMD